MAHVELADRCCGLRTVGDTIDHEPAGTTDSFPAIVIESDRFVTLRNEIFIEHIEHFQKRHMRIHIRMFVLDHTADVVWAFLPPDMQSQFHYL
jgi:hypothetical protein